jgi:ATP-dependent Lon protease
MLEGSTQVIVQTHERVRIRAFSANDAGYEAEIEDLVEGPMGENSDLISRAVKDFAKYAEINQSAAGVEPKLRQLHDAGRIADVIAQSLPIAVKDKQSLLAKLDPAERLEAVLNHLKVA